MADATYGPKIYRKQGGDELAVKAGGKVDGLIAHQLDFTETTGAGTYTGTVTIPAGAVIADIIVHNTALWTATTSASLEVGDGDDADGFFTAVDLKATDLLANESISLQGPQGGVGGVYATAGTSTHITNRVAAAERTITATVVTVGAAGAAGRTSVLVMYALPSTVTAATKA